MFSPKKHAELLKTFWALDDYYLFTQKACRTAKDLLSTRRLQPRYGHKNMRIRTKPLRSLQRGAESKNKRVLDNRLFTCQTIVFLSEWPFVLPSGQGPEQAQLSKLIRTTSTLAKIRVVLILCLDRMEKWWIVFSSFFHHLFCFRKMKKLKAR